MENSLITNLSFHYLISEAKKRGIKHEEVGRNFVRFEKDGHVEFFEDELSSHASVMAYKICKNKARTKYFLSLAGLRVPEGKDFFASDYEQASFYFDSVEKPIVIKPKHGSKGSFVFTEIDTKEEFRKGWNSITSIYKSLIVEKQYEWPEYRIFATREKAISIIKRVPANVVGDGTHTIDQLIKIKNNEKINRISSLKREINTNIDIIVIDSVVNEMLRKNKLSLSYIPAKDEQIFLRKNSNLSTGGERVDFTSVVDPSIKDIAVKAVNSIPGLPYAGVDVLAKEISRPQNENNYVILELNASPGLGLHYFQNSEDANVAKEIIDIAFPETMHT